MSEEHNVVFNLNIDVQETVRELRSLETVLYRALGLARQFGLPEDVDAAITKIQRLIATLNLLRATFIATQMATGPLGWVSAGLGAATTAFSIADLAMEL